MSNNSCGKKLRFSKSSDFNVYRVLRGGGIFQCYILDNQNGLRSENFALQSIRKIISRNSKKLRAQYGNVLASIQRSPVPVFAKSSHGFQGPYPIGLCGDTTHNNDVQRVRQLNMVSPKSRIPLPKIVYISYVGGLLGRSIFSADEDSSRIICVLNLTHQLKDTPPFLVCTNMVCSDPQQIGFLVRYAHIETHHWKPGSTGLYTRSSVYNLVGKSCSRWSNRVTRIVCLWRCVLKSTIMETVIILRRTWPGLLVIIQLVWNCFQKLTITFGATCNYRVTSTWDWLSSVKHADWSSG